MKSILFACAIFALALGVNAAPVPPADSFRLTVEESVQTSACRVINLKIEARSAAMVDLRWEHGAKQGVQLAPAREGKLWEGRVTLASMLEDGVHCHTATVVHAGGGGSASLVETFEVTRGSKLESIVPLTVTNGVFKLNLPLVIGQSDGQTLRLSVGSSNQERVMKKD